MYRDHAFSTAASRGRWRRGHILALGLLWAAGGCKGSIDPSTTPGGKTKPPVGDKKGDPDPIVDEGTLPPPPSTCKESEIGFSPLRRLTRVEYDNSIRDLLGVDLGLSREFSDDERAGAFPSNFFTPISESQFSQYASGAATAAAKAVERLPQLLPCAAGLQASGEAACAGQFIRQFGRRAYRRPLDDAELGRYQALFRSGREGGTFAGGVELVLTAMLESPHFLYLVEGPGPLNQHQLAARLSYFLWNAPPDAPLAALADANNLNTVEALRGQAKRMLGDPRAQDMIADFHTRWLDLESLAKVEKDPAIYGDFDGVRAAIREETGRFANHVLGQGDGKLDTLLTASFTVANGPLAKLYGARGPAGADTWQRIDLDATQRAGGVLTQFAFLAAHGQEDSAPIFRGLTIREQLFCVDLPPPPPGADQELPPKTATTTTRDRLSQHRLQADCAACHDLMDVLGYGFESYDGIGRFRTMEAGRAVDDSGEIIGTEDADGKFNGVAQLSKKLVASAQVQRCVTNHWFRYAMGRIETDLDRCTLDSVLGKFQKAKLSIPELLLALVESDGFRVRREEVRP